MSVKLDDIVTYLEGRFATIAKYANSIAYTSAENELKNVKAFGVRIYPPKDGVVEYRNRHIGPILTEIFTVNVDIVIKKAFKTDRQSVSDADGISAEIESVKLLLLHNRNSETFRDAWWSPGKPYELGGSIIVPGTFVAEVQNEY